MTLGEAEIEKERLRIIKACKTQIADILTVSRQLFGSVFPVAKVSPGNGKTFDAHQVFEYKIRQIQSWVKKALSDTLLLAQSNEPIEIIPSSLALPRAIAEEVVDAMVHVFTTGRDLTDTDYYYISDVSNAVGLDSLIVGKVIEQAQYEIRKVFFASLVDELDDEQCFGCAVLLMNAIQADGSLHPAEFKYIENIAQLLDNDQSEIERVERYYQDHDEIPRVFLPQDLACYLFKYLIELVMCDGEYEARETEFIKKVGQAFGLDKDMQDEIIQPVAAALMVKSALFPKEPI